MNDCVFCDIISHKRPAKIVRDWGEVVAFLPLDPVTDGHTLVVPKVHVKDFTESITISSLVMAAATDFARGSTCNLITSAGVEATQSVFHLHMHLVPRRKNDGLKLPWSDQNNSKEYTNGQRE